MKNSMTEVAAAAFLVTVVGASAASAAPVNLTGPTALAVAAVVAQYSPLLNPGERKVIAGLFDGNGKISYPKKKLSVGADSVTAGSAMSPSPSAAATSPSRRASAP